MSDPKLPRVGVSSCLLGEPVRYDGAHKRRDSLIEAFRGKLDWVPVCPEFELGLGVPREPIRLELRGGEIRLIAERTRVDLSERMRQWAEEKLSEPAMVGLSGFIFKARSPSCGVGSAPLLPPAGKEMEKASGLFARAVLERFPGLPAAEEDELETAADREAFLARVLAHHNSRNRP